MHGIEEQIRQAMAEGKFSDLPGKGKPLDLDENPFADPDWRLAYHLLSTSGFTLPWIESRREILAEIRAARLDLSQAWAWTAAARNAGREPAYIQEIWMRAEEQFCQKAAALNRRIFSYNLQAPTHHLQVLRLDIEAELLAVQNQIPSTNKGVKE
jgi:DnaJ family protein C protein 28